MEVIQVPFCGVYITDRVVVITLQCHNCQDEIDFAATFKTLADVPVFKPVDRCPVCRKWFTDSENNFYAVVPYGGKTVERLMAIARAIECRQPTRAEIHECRREEERKVVHLPANLRTSEKCSRKRKKEKKPPPPTTMSLCDKPV